MQWWLWSRSALGNSWLLLVSKLFSLGILLLSSGCRVAQGGDCGDSSQRNSLIFRAVMCAPTALPSGYRLSVWRDGRLQVKLGSDKVVYDVRLDQEQLQVFMGFTSDDDGFRYGDTGQLHGRFVRFVNLGTDGWLFFGEIGDLDCRRDPPPDGAYEHRRFVEVIRFWLFVEELLPCCLGLDRYGDRLRGYLTTVVPE